MCHWRITSKGDRAALQASTNLSPSGPSGSPVSHLIGFDKFNFEIAKFVGLDERLFPLYPPPPPYRRVIITGFNCCNLILSFSEISALVLGPNRS